MMGRRFGRGRFRRRRFHHGFGRRRFGRGFRGRFGRGFRGFRRF